MRLWEHKENKRRKIVEIETPFIRYQAKQDSVHNQCKFILAVKNKDKVNYFEVEGPFNLTQKLLKNEDFTPASDNIFKESSYWDKKLGLTETFGTRKAKSKMNAIKSNRVDEPNISTSKEMNVLLKQGVRKIEDEKE